ncbi:TetR/AcrR family transcriptional regulator [Ottowia sp.]|uniref:TetR/AcrR family transcriptional regulator n=1 Tax=Ottowia sp. TaxID=1898956 RepID=UPI002B921E48|nr:TetR/AcrR family transcriptional regulator [Ottowia sp.]MCP5259039.1 TetR/AcrR family transcriptional regulator [Burkholderiaceae bacterium]HRW72622.1 TetR/AcrR family transcriptional regulator [Ottowia sp.]
MTRKAPRRTAERIAETTLALFNRFGEPNVSTTQISAELNISPGNLYYHYPSKDELVNALFDRYENALSVLLPASGDVRDVEDAWFFLHTLLELIWQYRFLYRDLNHLLSRNRRLETHFPAILRRKKQALGMLVDHLTAGSGVAPADERARDALAANLVVLLTWWLSYEYVLNPRQALEPQNAEGALLRGAWHGLGLLVPYLDPGPRAHLQALLAAYDVTTT